METRAISPDANKLTAEEEVALASQVMEIIGGITGGAAQTPEEPEEKDLWSLEEGDDSVFYSDEEQAHQDLRDAALSTFGANVCRRLANSVADDEPAQPMEEDDNAEKMSVIEKERIQQMMWTEEMQRNLEAPKNTQVISAAVKGGIELDGSCGELNGTRPPEQKVNQQVEEDVQETQTPEHDAFDASNIQSQKRLNGGAEVLQPHTFSNNGQLERDRDCEQDHDFHAGFREDHGPGYFTLPLMKNAAPSVSRQRTFNHLSSSKYSTTSYRRIRRGNTRQRIEEFEFIMKSQ